MHRTLSGMVLGLAVLAVMAGGWPARGESSLGLLQEGSGFRSRSYEGSGSRIRYPIYPVRPAEMPVSLLVRVPADAKLQIEGLPTQQTGEVRRFISPPVMPGRDYTYTVKGTWKEGDKEVVRERVVTVRAGEETSVDLRQEPAGKP